MKKPQQKADLSPSEYCRVKGLDSFAELQRLSKIPERTLLNWYLTRSSAFALLVAGAVVEKKRILISDQVEMKI